LADFLIYEQQGGVVTLYQVMKPGAIRPMILKVRATELTLI
jgi:hypothetical protein